MKQVKIEVKNCRGCCFGEANTNIDLSIATLEEQFQSAQCYAPVEIHTGKYDVSMYYLRGDSPKWCPLKKQSLKIEFKK